jgi:hypothetical protein
MWNTLNETWHVIRTFSCESCVSIMEHNSAIFHLQCVYKRCLQANMSGWLVANNSKLLLVLMLALHRVLLLVWSPQWTWLLPDMYVCMHACIMHIFLFDLSVACINYVCISMHTECVHVHRIIDCICQPRGWERIFYLRGLGFNSPDPQTFMNTFVHKFTMARVQNDTGICVPKHMYVCMYQDHGIHGKIVAKSFQVGVWLFLR